MFDWLTLNAVYPICQAKSERWGHLSCTQPEELLFTLAISSATQSVGGSGHDRPGR